MLEDVLDCRDGANLEQIWLQIAFRAFNNKF